MAALDFKCLPDARQPIAGMFWEPSCPVLHVFERTGRELLIDVSRDSVLAYRHRAALEGAEQIEPSPCCRYMAILRAGKVSVWNSQKDRVVASPVSSETVERVAWRPRPPNSEGQLWLAGSFGLGVWSAEGDFTIPFRQFTSYAGAMAWDPTGTCLARGCRDGELHIWNARTDQKAKFEQPGGHPIREFAWNSKGAILAGTSTNSLFVWNVSAALHGNTPAPLIRRLTSAVSRLAFRPSGNVIAVGAIDGTVLLCRACKRDEASRSAVLDGAISHLGWSRNGKQLAVALCSGPVHAARICK